MQRMERKERENSAFSRSAGAPTTVSANHAMGNITAAVQLTAKKIAQGVSSKVNLLKHTFVARAKLTNEVSANH